MEELAQFDPNLVVGILGGSAGTTYDAFRLIHDAQKYGARVALFGRKINNAEHQLAFIEMLRLITDGKLTPEEAVRAYHGVLQAKNIKPKLPLEKDLELTDQAMSYDAAAASRSVSRPATPASPRPARRQRSQRGSQPSGIRARPASAPQPSTLIPQPSPGPSCPTALPTSRRWTSPSAAPTTCTG